VILQKIIIEKVGGQCVVANDFTDNIKCKAFNLTYDSYHKWNKSTL